MRDGDHTMHKDLTVDRVLGVLDKLGVRTGKLDKDELKILISRWRERNRAVVTEGRGSVRAAFLQSFPIGSGGSAAWPLAETFGGYAGPLTRFAVWRADVREYKRLKKIAEWRPNVNADVDISRRGIELTSSDWKSGRDWRRDIDTTDALRQLRPEFFLSIHVCETHIEGLSDQVTAYAFARGAVPNQYESDVREGFRKKVNHALAKIEQSYRKGVYVRIGRHIPASIRRIVRYTGIVNAYHLAGWLLADGKSQAQTYRAQAIKAYPFLAQYIALMSRVAFEEKRKDRKNDNYSDFAALTHHIDTGQPLAQLLTTRAIIANTPMSPTALRNLGRIKEFPAGDDTPERLSYLSYLNNIDSTWHPRNAEQLMAFYDAMTRMKRIESMTGMSVASMIPRTHGKWDEWNRKTKSYQTVQDMWDWLKAVYNNYLLPTVYQAITQGDRSRLSRTWMKAALNCSQAIAVQDFAGKYSEFELLACSQRWHERMEEYTARMGVLRQQYGYQRAWLPLSEPATVSHGITVKPETTYERLIEVGADLQHCVGTHGYWHKCMTQGCHIVGLYGSDGKRLTAVELHEVVKDGVLTDLTVVQHQGHKRRAPTETEKQALDEYIQLLLKDRRYRVDYKAFEAARAKNRRLLEKSDEFADIGYDPNDPEARRQAMEIMRDYMPADARIAGLRPIFTTASTRDVILREMSYIQNVADRRVRDEEAKRNHGPMNQFF